MSSTPTFQRVLEKGLLRSVPDESVTISLFNEFQGALFLSLEDLLRRECISFDAKTLEDLGFYLYRGLLLLQHKELEINPKLEFQILTAYLDSRNQCFYRKHIREPLALERYSLINPLGFENWIQTESIFVMRMNSFFKDRFLPFNSSIHYEFSVSCRNIFHLKSMILNVKSQLLREISSQNLKALHTLFAIFSKQLDDAFQEFQSLYLFTEEVS